MPDLWDELPTALFGERPPIECFSKEVVAPDEVQKKERGKDAEENLRQVFGSPEIK
tara:strand:- start:228 stop:395 length:168 start_codon:yes stop_codon:yes gene_type:complete